MMIKFNIQRSYEQGCSEPTSTTTQVTKAVVNSASRNIQEKYDSIFEDDNLIFTDDENADEFYNSDSEQDGDLNEEELNKICETSNIEPIYDSGNAYIITESLILKKEM